MNNHVSAKDTSIHYEKKIRSMPCWWIWLLRR